MIMRERKIKTKYGRVIVLKEVEKEINLDTLKKMLEPGMLRRERSVIDGLPKPIAIIHTLKMSKVQTEIERAITDIAYDHPEKQLSCFIYGLENATSPAMILPFIQDYAPDLLGMAQEDTPPKFEEIGGIIDEAVGLKLIVYSRYVKALKLIQKMCLIPEVSLLPT